MPDQTVVFSSKELLMKIWENTNMEVILNFIHLFTKNITRLFILNSKNWCTTPNFRCQLVCFSMKSVHLAGSSTLVQLDISLNH